MMLILGPVMLGFALWATGFFLMWKTKWVVQRMRHIQRQDEESERDAERPWYPRFIQILGALCMIGGAVVVIFSMLFLLDPSLEAGA